MNLKCTRVLSLSREKKKGLIKVQQSKLCFNVYLLVLGCRVTTNTEIQCITLKPTKGKMPFLVITHQRKTVSPEFLKMCAETCGSC